MEILFSISHINIYYILVKYILIGGKYDMKLMDVVIKYTHLTDEALNSLYKIIDDYKLNLAIKKVEDSMSYTLALDKYEDKIEIDKGELTSFIESVTNFVGVHHNDTENIGQIIYIKDGSYIITDTTIISFDMKGYITNILENDNEMIQKIFDSGYTIQPLSRYEKDRSKFIAVYHAIDEVLHGDIPTIEDVNNDRKVYEVYTNMCKLMVSLEAINI